MENYLFESEKLILNQNRNITNTILKIEENFKKTQRIS